jgi:hypothetical protein
MLIMAPIILCAPTTSKALNHFFQFFITSIKRIIIFNQFWLKNQCKSKFYQKQCCQVGHHDLNNICEIFNP